MSMKKGYSLVVLVIAIAVILILSSVSITMLITSRDTIESADFINDITTVEEVVKQYVAKAGTLPIVSEVPITIPTGMNSQLDLLDNEKYYDISLGKLENVSVVDRERGYVLNEGTLRVYCKTPLIYKGKEYYTVTNELMGKEVDYQSQAEEITVVGNPMVWSKTARMRLVIPARVLEMAGVDGTPEDEFWDNWTLMWDFGPKSIENMKTSATAKTFSYGDTLIAKTNGVYTIYVKDSSNKETLLNVVVTKVDDIKPKYAITENFDSFIDNIEIIDNETGIDRIYYKTLAEYMANVEYAESIGEGVASGRNELDFFLINGTGKSLIDDLPVEVEDYLARYELIENRVDAEEERFEAIPEEERDYEEHDRILDELLLEKEALKSEYPYFDKPAALGNSPEQLVLYVVDKAGNAVVIGAPRVPEEEDGEPGVGEYEDEHETETINFMMLAAKYNIIDMDNPKYHVIIAAVAGTSD